MRILTFTHMGWLTNNYLLLNEESKTAILIDAGAPVSAFQEELRQSGASLEGVFITHSHFDHTEHVASWSKRYIVKVFVHEMAVPVYQVRTQGLKNQEQIALRGFEVTALHTPGHTADHICYVVNKELVFTGDLLFKGSVGGTREGSFAELKESLLNKVLQLPAGTKVYPGHGPLSTVGEEAEHNPFVRALRGLTPLCGKACQFEGRPAKLQVIAKDYDDERKAWIEMGGEQLIVPWEAEEV